MTLIQVCKNKLRKGTPQDNNFFLGTVEFIAQSSQHHSLEPTDVHEWITEKTNEDAAAQFLSLENIQCITNPNSKRKVSWKDAENAMDTLIKLFEKMPDCTIVMIS